MTDFDPTDPAAQIKYLKALEQAKWPDTAPDSSTLKKKPADWPDAPGGKKKSRAAHSWVAPELGPPAAIEPEGIPLGEVIRAVILLAAAVAAALLID